MRRREEDLLPARETRSKSSAAERCGCGGACVWRARCGVAADREQLKFLRLSIWRHSQRETPSHAEKGADSRSATFEEGAREQFRVVLRFLEAREPACPPALVEEMRRLLDGVGGGGGE